jgi:hypothetical protein
MSKGNRTGKPTLAMERAYQALAENGVTRERARSVSNGISLLAARLRHEIAELQRERDQLRAARDPGSVKHSSDP